MLISIIVRMKAIVDVQRCASGMFYLVLFFVFFSFSFFPLHIYSVAPSNFSCAYSMPYAPYLVLGRRNAKKKCKKVKLAMA
jgi:uncharacterized membrane protein SpoIIM required for sporulation